MPHDDFNAATGDFLGALFDLRSFLKKDDRHSTAKDLLGEHYLEALKNYTKAIERARRQKIVTTDYDSTSLLTRAIKALAPKKTVIGRTHWGIDSDWWKSGDAQSFWEENLAAIKERKIKVARLFVHELDEKSGARSINRLREELIKQQDAEVDVRILGVSMRQSNRKRHRSACAIENVVAYQVDFDKTGRYPISNLFDFGRDSVNAAFRDLKDEVLNAEEFDRDKHLNWPV
jgi:hypothetical protein